MDSDAAPHQGPGGRCAPRTPSETRRLARASLREEFLALFRSTEARSAPDQSTPSRATIMAPPSSEPSVYLHRYLREAVSYPGEKVPSGFTGLDEHLSGGFGAGLHVVAGRPRVGKSAFLLSVAWESIADKRPVLYYALRENGLAVWARLASTASYILGDRVLSLEDIQARSLDATDRNRLAAVDCSLQTAVLPYLSLIEAIPAGSDSLSAFVKDICVRAGEAASRHGRHPLLLVDDLDRLLVLTRVRPVSHLLAVLDEALIESSLAGLIAATTAGPLALGEQKPEVRTVSTLVPVAGGESRPIMQVRLDVQHDEQAGWTGSIPLLLDARSRLFSETPV